MSDRSYSTAFYHLVLGGCSVRAISSLPCNSVCFKWAYKALGLYYVQSCVGLVRFGFPDYVSDKLKEAYDHIFFLSTVFGLPCIATELYLYHHYPWEYAILHIGYASIPIAAHISNTWSDEVLNVFVAGNMLSVCCLGIVEENNYAIAAALTYGVNYFVIGATKNYGDTPAIDMFTLCLCYFTFFSVQALLTDKDALFVE